MRRQTWHSAGRRRKGGIGWGDLDVTLTLSVPPSPLRTLSRSTALPARRPESSGAFGLHGRCHHHLRRGLRQPQGSSCFVSCQPALRPPHDGHGLLPRMLRGRTQSASMVSRAFTQNGARRSPPQPRPTASLCPPHPPREPRPPHPTAGPLRAVPSAEQLCPYISACPFLSARSCPAGCLLSEDRRPG